MEYLDCFTGLAVSWSFGSLYYQKTMKQPGLWSSLGTHGSMVVIWWLCISSSCTSGPNLVILAWMVDALWCGQAQNVVNFDFDPKFDLDGKITKRQTNNKKNKNNRNLNQGVLHLWSKFGDPSLNGWWVIARTNLVTDGLTDRRRQRQ